MEAKIEMTLNKLRPPKPKPSIKSLGTATFCDDNGHTQATDPYEFWTQWADVCGLRLSVSPIEMVSSEANAQHTCDFARKHRYYYNLRARMRVCARVYVYTLTASQVPVWGMKPEKKGSAAARDASCQLESDFFVDRSVVQMHFDLDPSRIKAV